MKQNITSLAILLFCSVGLFAQQSVSINKQHVLSKTSVTKTTLLKQQSVLEEEVPKRKCATPPFGEQHAAYEAWISEVLAKQNQFANERKTTTVYNIPVIFHIIHTGVAVGSGRNISQAQVNSQITILNQAFRKTNTDLTTYASNFQTIAADCEINFCAAKVSPTGAILPEPGIDRITTSSKGWSSPPYSSTNGYIDGTIKPASSWDPTKYLNIWILEFNDGTLGYAQFPSVPSSGTPTIGDMAGMGGAANTDGVVFDYRFVGDVGAATPPYNKGRTAVHEIGHWLGLYHIWGDDGTSCSGSDMVADTPNQSGENYTCPTSNGAVRTDVCTSSSPGVNYQNYMDYSDDKCMVMFTAGQKARMQACMQYCARRTSLNTSTVCAVPNGVEESVSNISMSVFPNPTNGELNVNIETLDIQDYTLSVVNTLGQTVKEIKQIQSHGGVVKIDLSGFNAGVYFVVLKSKAGNINKRIILQ